MSTRDTKSVLSAIGQAKSTAELRREREAAAEKARAEAAVAEEQRRAIAKLETKEDQFAKLSHEPLPTGNRPLASIVRATPPTRQITSLLLAGLGAASAVGLAGGYVGAPLCGAVTALVIAGIDESTRSSAIPESLTAWHEQTRKLIAGATALSSGLAFLATLLFGGLMLSFAGFAAAAVVALVTAATGRIVVRRNLSQGPALACAKREYEAVRAELEAAARQARRRGAVLDSFVTRPELVGDLDVPAPDSPTPTADMITGTPDVKAQPSRTNGTHFSPVLS
ncbi:MAG: hypothetical protein HY791_31645 [Deltaproteobacteria bacterium]|nr:hypothetical protein [Deltaproteobacteria bacterium]